MNSDPKHEFVTAVEKAHGRQLRKYLAARMRSCSEDVPDLVQEVFLRLLRVDDHEAIRNPQAYLYTIATHVLYQHSLRQSVIKGIELTDAEELEATASSDPAALADYDELVEGIQRALGQLSPRVCATFVMHRCDGVPLKDVSTRLGVSYTMTKRYLARALAVLAATLPTGSARREVE